jgi:hypothetical protein
MVCFSLVLLLSVRKESGTSDVKFKNRKDGSFIVKPKATKLFYCPSPDPDPDATICSGAYTAAANAAAVAASNPALWDSEAITAATNAINTYIDKCPASRCFTGCPGIVNVSALTSPPDGSAVETACKPPVVAETTVIADDDCPTDASNTEATCQTAYNEVVTAINVTAPASWVAATIVTKIDAYVVACAKAACATTCRPVISGVNVARQYTNLLLNLTEKCNPYPPPPPPPPEGDIGFTTFPHSLVLIFSLIAFLLGFDLITYI